MQKVVCTINWGNMEFLIYTKLLSFLCSTLRIIAEWISQIICWSRYRNVQKSFLPPITNSILNESSISLAQKIRTKKLSSEDVVMTFITRIKEVNPFLNAVVHDNFQKALAEARAIDDFLHSNNINEDEIAITKPFLGVPFTIKDCFAVTGLKLTAGLYGRKNIIAEKDAEVVRLMKDAGAITLGITNVPELCMWWESSNTIYGRSNNPYDFTRTVGGSSGGEGSILSAGGSPMGIGSDIGGSIRMPCYFNGIFGHKPTSGIVSNVGKVPETAKSLEEYQVTGPMCRFAADLIPLFKVMADSNVHLLNLDKRVNLKEIKIYYMEGDGGCPLVGPVEREILMAQRKVLEYFRSSYDVTPVEVNFCQMRNSVGIYFAKLGAAKDVPSFSSQLTMQKRELKVWTELLKCIFGGSKHTFPALGYAILQKITQGRNNEKLIEDCEVLKAKFKSLLGDNGVLIYPSHPTTAPYHSQPLFRPFNFSYTAIFNVIGLPVTQCPLGLDSKGLPLGIQVVADQHQDHLSLAVAEEIETAFGGWVDPSSV